MVFKLVETKEIAKFGQAQAEYYLKLNNYEAQRNLRRPRIVDLTAKLTDGRFTKGNIAMARLVYDGNRETLVNGQHVCTVIKDNPTHCVPCVIDTYVCDTPKDLANLFSQFDDSLGTRSNGEIARTAKVRLGLDDWHKRTVELMISALGLLGLAGAATRVGRDQKAMLLTEVHVPAGSFVNKVLFGHSGEIPTHMTRHPVVAAMIQTYEADVGDSQSFWDGIRTGEMMAADDPQMRLRNWLMAQGTDVTRTRSAQNEALAKCIMAWNDYRTGRRSRLSYRGEIPKAV